MLRNTRRSNSELGAIIAIVAAVIALIATCLAAFVTHIIICIKTSQWLLLIAGAILPFIGVLHGAMSWFGAW